MSWADNINSAAKVKTSVRKGVTIVYSANGRWLKQVEEVTTIEYRGLTNPAASGSTNENADNGNFGVITGGQTVNAVDNSQEQKLYAMNGNDCVVCSVRSGTKMDIQANRANETDGWNVTKEIVRYSWLGSKTGGTSHWTTSLPSAAKVGIVSSQSSTNTIKQVVFGDNFRETQTNIVTVYRFQTEAEAANLIAANTYDARSWTSYPKFFQQLDGNPPEYFYSYGYAGTVSSASSQYVDADNLYTVTVNKSSFSYSYDSGA